MREYNKLMANLTKEYFDKKIDGLDKGLKSYVEKKFDESKEHSDKLFEDLNTRTARAFTGVQTQLSTMHGQLEDVQRKVTDADLPKIKKDQKLIKEAIGLTP